MVTDYVITRGDTVYKGTVESKEFEFEISQTDLGDDLRAPMTPSRTIALSDVRFETYYGEKIPDQKVQSAIPIRRRAGRRAVIG
jgi:hypothetical protein